MIKERLKAAQQVFMEPQFSLQHGPRLLLVCILSQINSANRVASYFLETHFNIIIQSKPGRSKWSLFFLVFLRTFLRISILSMPATCCTHIIVPDLMILIIFLEDYKLRNSSLRTFLQPPFISFLFVSNISPAHLDKDGYRLLSYEGV